MIRPKRVHRQSMLSVGDVIQSKYWYIVHKLVAYIVELRITSDPCTIKSEVDVRESQTDSDVKEVNGSSYLMENGFQKSLTPEATDAYL